MIEIEAIKTKLGPSYIGNRYRRTQRKVQRGDADTVWIDSVLAAEVCLFADLTCIPVPLRRKLARKVARWPSFRHEDLIRD